MRMGTQCLYHAILWSAECRESEAVGEKAHEKCIFIHVSLRKELYHVHQTEEEKPNKSQWYLDLMQVHYIAQLVTSTLIFDHSIWIEFGIVFKVFFIFILCCVCNMVYSVWERRVAYIYAPLTTAMINFKFNETFQKTTRKNKEKKYTKKCHATDSISCFQYHNHWPKKYEQLQQATTATE